MKTLICIDPGKSGGIAWSHGPRHVEVEKMPDTEADVVSLLREIIDRAHIETDDVEAHVEEVGGFIGGNKLPGSAMFNFGFGCGVIEGALHALTIRTIYVRPQKWQKHFSVGTRSGCISTAQWKGKLKSEAQRRFPQSKVTLHTADALLMLEYARTLQPETK